MKLADAITAAVPATTAPAAVLARTYAERIDEATHVPLALAKALDTLRQAAEAYDEDRVKGGATEAYERVAAQLAAVTVASDLGPKLLAALDALTLTPKALAALTKGVQNAAPPARPLGALRDGDPTGRHLRVVS